jgi:hypothetical protein
MISRSAADVLTALVLVGSLHKLHDQAAMAAGDQPPASMSPLPVAAVLKDPTAEDSHERVAAEAADALPTFARTAGPLAAASAQTSDIEQVCRA